ncbi:MAG: 23S rRNA (adenine(2503)-C(2))-methyltransferase RlmN [Acidobacteria bacterium]|nr:23S rRNA (adenine(2503)-C(2))-methyltransferase RlmN [Acidobacteriota bacterium]
MALKTEKSQENLIGMTQQELTELAEEMGEPAYRGLQLYHSIYAKRIFDFALATDLPIPFRRRLAENFKPALPVMHSHQVSNDGTVKLLLSLQDGEKIECVYIPERRRDTLCISSQAGCAAGCAFCATGEMGLRRNLTAGEIVGQLLFAIDFGMMQNRSFNIVMMGMGEPLHNFDEVMRSVQILCDPVGMGISHRRITLSTSGVVSGMERLSRQPIIPNLAVSLNATTDKTRSEIMPINQKWNIKALIDACQKFPLDSRRRITFEYVLLAGVNDSDEDARRLARLLQGLRAKVNLIAWNFSPGLGFQTPSPQRVSCFKAILDGKHLSAFQRRPRGLDIYAACGQLALQ